MTADSTPAADPAADTDAPRSLGQTLFLRLWPYACGALLCLFFAFAEIQNWTPFSGRPFSSGILDWLTSRFSAPVRYFIADPAGAWFFVPLLFFVTRYAYRPRWWNGPLAVGGMMVWCIWGSRILGAGLLG